MKKEKMQEISFQMIAGIGGAKFKAMDAFKQFQKDGDKKAALKTIKAAEKELGNVGTLHLDIMSKEAAGEDLPFSMILMHAEDQYMTAQVLIEMMLLMVG